MTVDNEIGMIKGLPITLPQSRGMWAASVGSLILCFVFYYFYGGFLTLALFAVMILGE